MVSSGIYVIKSNRYPEKMYIGSAVNLEQRKKRHFRELEKNIHFNKKLQNFYNKYGSNSLSFYVLQHVLVKNLLKTEQKYLDNLKPFFNINPMADSRLGAVHSNSTKLKIKTSLIGRKYYSFPRHLWHRADKHQL